MDFDDYQAFTRTTAKYQDACPRPGERLLYCLMGLTGEVGETAEKLKKVYRRKGLDGLDTVAAEDLGSSVRYLLKKELGDILWYLARLADEMGMSMSDVAQTNVDKLSDRKDRGVLHAEGDER